QVFDLLGVEGIEDVKEDQLITLRGLANAIKDGETTVEEAFTRPGSLNTEATQDLNDRIRRRQQKEAAAEKPFREPEPAEAGDLTSLMDEPAAASAIREGR